MGLIVPGTKLAAARAHAIYRPAVLLLAPAVLFLIAFLLSPLVNLVVLSFLTHSATRLWTFKLTIENYVHAIDGYYVALFFKSIRIAAVSTAFSLLLGFPLSYYLARCSATALSVGLFLLMVPQMVSTVIRAFGWMIVLSRNGLLNQLLSNIGIPPLNIMYSETAVIIGTVQLVLPLMVLPIMASIENIPRELEEAACNLGCGFWGIFAKVLWPISIPGVTSGSVLCFGVSVSIVVTSTLLGGRRGRMIGNEIYDQVLTGLNWPFASALSVLLMIGIFLLLWSVTLVIRRRRTDALGGR
jgi:ABC-type spermidine/putrescine transport system permease subunit I